MIEKLHTLYQNDFTTDIHVDGIHKYVWFTERTEKKIFGIKRERLTHNEFQIISIFADKYILTEASNQSRWYQYIYDGRPLQESIQEVRFYYFYSNSMIEEKELFSETICGLFSKSSIVWLSDKNGWIVDESPPCTTNIEDVNQLLQSLTSDFLINVKIIIGQFHKVDKLLPQKILSETLLIHDFLEHSISKNIVFTFSEIIINSFLLSQQPFSFDVLSDYLISSLEEKELVETIKVFIENNLNITQTGKKMYLHRNSIQYRIEKFIQSTGVDIRQYREALGVYLIILYKELKK